MPPLQPSDPRRVGSYQLLGRLGGGGMGDVYLGRSPGGRLVAVKLVKEDFRGDADYRARFRREVTAARRVTGAFTAPVLDADPDATIPWLVTAYLPGISLDEAITTAGPLPTPTVRALAAGLAEALVDIHRVGLTHRDLKPGNIMLTADGPRVIDFGIVRPADVTSITAGRGWIGTLRFASPEQATGNTVGTPSDIFSFGSVLTFAATGAGPFDCDTELSTLLRVQRAEADLNGITDSWLRQLISSCLRLVPAERPSATRLLDQLSEIAEPVTGVGWLPAPLAEEIDRRTAAAWQPSEESPLTPANALKDQPPAEPAAAGLPTKTWAHPDAVAPDEPTNPGLAGDPTSDGGPDHRRQSREPDPRPPNWRPLPGELTRRHLLVGGAIALAATASVLPLLFGGNDASRDPARSGGGDPATRTSMLAPVGAPSASPAAPPRATVRWRTKVSDYYPELFLARGVVVAKTSEDELYALDTRTGRIRWKHPATLVGTVVGNLVLEAQSSNPRLAAVDPLSGAKRWSYRVPIREMPLNSVLAGSVVVSGIDRLRAVDVRDGRLRWTTDLDSVRTLAASDSLVVAATDTGLVGLHARTGRTRWRRWMSVPCPVLTDGGMVFTIDLHRVMHALRGTDGRPVWQLPGFDPFYTPQIGAGRLYACGPTNGVTALTVATGEPQWIRHLGHPALLALQSGTLYAATTEHTLYALDPIDGQVRWTYQADMLEQPAMGVAQVVSTAGLVFIGTRAGYVEALVPPTGGPGVAA